MRSPRYSSLFRHCHAGRDGRGARLRPTLRSAHSAGLLRRRRGRDGRALVRAGGAVGYCRAGATPPSARNAACPCTKLACPAGALVIRIACTAFFVFLSLPGITGEQNPFRNIVVVSAGSSAGLNLIGFGAPWRRVAIDGSVEHDITPHGAAARVYARGGGLLGAKRVYPKSLGAWPAFVLFAGFPRLELVWNGRDVPARLAQAMLAYSLLTWTGMFVFGREVWRVEEHLRCLGSSLASESLPSARVLPQQSNPGGLSVFWSREHWTPR